MSKANILINNEHERELFIEIVGLANSHNRYSIDQCNGVDIEICHPGQPLSFLPPQKSTMLLSDYIHIVTSSCTNIILLSHAWHVMKLALKSLTFSLLFI